MKPSSIPLLLFISLTILPSWGQKQFAPKDTSVVDEINKRAWQLRNNELEQSKNLAIDAINRAIVLNYQRGLSYSYNVLGHYYKVKGAYDTSLKYYRKSLEIRQNARDTISIVSSYRNIMSISKLKGNYFEAIETGKLALNLLSKKEKEPNAQIEKARVLNNMSALYLKIRDLNEAMNSALVGKKIFSSYDDKEGLASIYITLGNIYERQKEFNKALSNFQEAIKIHTQSNNERELAKAYNSLGNIYYSVLDFNRALESYRLCLNLRTKNGFDDDVPGALFNMGNIFESLGQHDSALKYLNESLRLNYASGNVEGRYETHRSISEVLNSQQKHQEAIFHLRNAYLLSHKSRALPEKLILLKLLGSTYKELGKQDSALFFFEAYDHLNDTLNEVLRRSIELESEIKGKESQLELSKEKNRLQMLIIIGMSIILLFAIALSILIYRSSRDRRGIRKLQEIIKEQELIAMDAMLEGQENERKRLSRELHDTIGSILAAAKYAFKSMEESLEKLVAENKSQYYKINTMLDEAMETVRRISHDMATGIILENGIEGALTQLCGRLEVTGKFKITLTVFGFNDKVDPIVELELYRIVQESLANTLKHANARNVSIQLTKGQTNINLIVEDDGIGFNPKDLTKKSGIGLNNMAERVKKLNGKWNIDSGKGKGTTVIVDIPINNDN